MGSEMCIRDRVCLGIREVAGGSFQELVTQGTPVHEIMQAVRESMPTEEFDALFGSIEAKQAVLGITGQNFETMSGNLDAMTGAAGSTEQAYNTMADTLAHQVNVAMTELKNIGLELGGAILPKLFDAFKIGRAYLAPIIQGFRDNLVPAMEVLVPLVRDGLTVAFQLAGAVMQGLSNTVLPSLGRLFKDITPFIRDMQELLSKWWASNGQQVIQYVKVLTTALGLGLAAAIETVRVAFMVIAPVIKFVAHLILGIIGVATRVANFIAPWALRLVDIFLAMNSYIVDAFAWALPGGIEDDIKDGIAGIRQSVQDGLAGLTTAAETEMESTRVATVEGVDNVAVALSDEDGKMAGALQRSMADVVAQVPPAMIGEEMSVRSNVIAGLNSTGDAIDDWFANKGLNLWRTNMSKLGDATYDAFYNSARGEGSFAIVPTFERGAADAGEKLLDNIDSIKKQAERWVWMGVLQPVAEGWDDIGRETEAGISRMVDIVDTDTTVRPAVEMWADAALEAPITAALLSGVAALRVGLEQMEDDARATAQRLTDILVSNGTGYGTSQGGGGGGSTPTTYNQDNFNADDWFRNRAGWYENRITGEHLSPSDYKHLERGGKRSVQTSDPNNILGVLQSESDKGNPLAQDYFNSLDVPDLPSLPKMAAGGIITRATTVLAGEAGPEAIIPLNQLDQTIGGGTQIIINGPIYGYNDFADKVRQVARDDVRFGGF